MIFEKFRLYWLWHLFETCDGRTSFRSNREYNFTNAISHYLTMPFNSLVTIQEMTGQGTSVSLYFLPWPELSEGIFRPRFVLIRLVSSQVPWDKSVEWNQSTLVGEQFLIVWCVHHQEPHVIICLVFIGSNYHFIAFVYQSRHNFQCLKELPSRLEPRSLLSHKWLARGFRRHRQISNNAYKFMIVSSTIFLLSVSLTCARHNEFWDSSMSGAYFIIVIRFTDALVNERRFMPLHPIPFHPPLALPPFSTPPFVFLSFPVPKIQLGSLGRWQLLSRWWRNPVAKWF
jgi:hypothetical protein